jgi:hypothetical protein
MKTQRPRTPRPTLPLRTGHNWFFFESEIIGLNSVPADTGLIEILENSPRLQAVRHRETGVIQAIFHQSGTLRHAEGWSIRTDRPCALLLRPDEKGRCHLTVAPLIPSTRRIRIHLQFWGHDKTHSLTLPTGVKAGCSVTQIL